MYNNKLDIYDAFYRSNKVIKTFMIYYAVFLLSLYILCSRNYEIILLFSLVTHRKRSGIRCLLSRCQWFDKLEW